MLAAAVFLWMISGVESGEVALRPVPLEAYGHASTSAWVAGGRLGGGTCMGDILAIGSGRTGRCATKQHAASRLKHGQVTHVIMRPVEEAVLCPARLRSGV